MGVLEILESFRTIYVKENLTKKIVLLKISSLKNLEKLNKNYGINFIAVRQIVFEIMEKNSFLLLNSVASPLNVWSEQTKNGACGRSFRQKKVKHAATTRED